MRRLCRRIYEFARGLTGALGCDTDPREACEPARGTEVWVERHYPSAGADTRPRPGRLPTSAARQMRGPCPCDQLHRDRPGVIVASGEQVHVNVQMRRPAYCSPVVFVSVR